MTPFHKLQIALLLLLFPTAAWGIVIRHDVADAQYRVTADSYPPLADLPGEGHGVLIARSWIVTAAHAVSWQHEPIDSILLNGQSRRVARIIVHPGYQRPPSELTTGDAAPLMDFLYRQDDIALIELVEPVDDVAPAMLLGDRRVRGQIARILGRGATGDGLRGQAADAPRRTALRRGYNRVERDEGRWLTYRFDRGRRALPLEAMLGNGDSGGPLLIEDAGVWKLAGLASWKSWTGDLSAFRGGIYGQESHYVRLAHYRDWIHANLGSHAAE